MKKILHTLSLSISILGLLSYSSCAKQSNTEIYQNDQAIPSAENLISNYLEYGTHLPGGGVSDKEFANIVGGLVKVNIDAGYFGNNTCALRLSHALNMGGHTIPYMKGETSSGGNGFKYMFRVKTMINYLNQTFGEPTIVGTKKEEFLGRKGIIVFDTGNLWSDATGHSTVFDGQKVLGGNYAGQPGYYFNNAVEIMLWEAN